MADERKKRRRRCSSCRILMDPGELQRVSGREALCGECLLVEAGKVAPLSAQAAEREAAERRVTPELAEQLESVGFEPTPAGELVRVKLPAPAVQPAVPEPRVAGDSSEEEEELYTRLPSVEVEGWPLRYGRLSASALACFARCPEQFRREYVHGERRPQSPAATVGSAIHRTLDVMWRYKVREDEDLPFDLALGVYVDVLRDISGVYEHKGILEWGPDGSDAWLLRGRKALDAYTSQVAAGVHPVASEEVFVRQIAGVPVPFCGFLDVRTDRAMVDTKFGAKKHRQITADWRIQALLYLQAFDLPMEYHSASYSGEVMTPATEPGLRLERTAQAFLAGAELVRRYTAAILAYAGTFGVHETWPGNITHTWACSSCSFRETTCAWWNAPTPMEVP